MKDNPSFEEEIVLVSRAIVALRFLVRQPRRLRETVGSGTRMFRNKTSSSQAATDLLARSFVPILFNQRIMHI